MKTFDKKDKVNLNLYNDYAYKIILADTAVDTGLYANKVYKNGKTRKVKAKGTLKQYVIITFSRKMMEYQRTIRKRQIERAKKLLKFKDPEKIKKGPKDIRRFLKNCLTKLIITDSESIDASPSISSYETNAPIILLIDEFLVALVLRIR